MNREIHVRFRESLGVKFPLATRLGGRSREAPAYPMCARYEYSLKGESP
nr:hypothetical protein [uncultured Sphaerochaeta sp.]